MKRLLIALTGSCMLLLCSCSGAGNGIEQQAGISPAEGTGLPPASISFPDFPVDEVQPGEELNADGFVIPERSAIASAISLNDEFQAGRDFFDESGTVGKEGAAATIQAGAEESVWTMHRFPMAGVEPGVLSVDANLEPGMQYYAAAANFSTGRWEWNGPFSDSHVRILLDPQSSHLSGLGNAWTAVLAYDGSEIDLVSVALAQRAIGDTDPPAQVNGVGGPITGSSVDLSWDPVLAGDLAGYAIYYSTSEFSNPDAAGVRNIGYLKGTTRYLLALPPDVYFIRVAAVDINGNRGLLSDSVTADIQDDTQQQITVSADSTLVPIGAELTITVSGAELYDVDVDGDGTFEVTGSGDTEFKMVMEKAGVLRSRVHGYDSGGTYTALSGLSVLVNIGNLPPFADLDASASNVAIGQVVAFYAFNSADLDGTIEQYEWDFNADNVFELDSGQDAFAANTFSEAGYHPVQLRVTDDDGDSSIAVIGILVRGGDFEIIAESGGSQNLELAIVNGNPAIAFTNNVGDRPWFQRATTPLGNQWGIPVKVYDDDDCSSSVSLAVVNGNPAMTFYDGVAQRGKYVRATDADGTAWGTAVEYNPGSNTGFQSDLTVINGNPAVVHNANSLMMYSRASNADGTAWNGPVTIDNTASTGISPILLDTVERPLSVFIRFTDVPNRWLSCDGDDADGTTWGSVLNGGDTDINNAVALDAIMTPVGSLAAYVASDGNWHELRAKYLRNVHINQWLAPIPVLTSDQIDDVKLGMAGGLPFIVYTEDSNHPRLILVPGMDQYGYSWGEPIILKTYDASMTFEIGVAEVLGRPAVAFKPSNENFVYYGIVYH
ncbi:hypothetical protein KDL29_09490 [bacterium]|nr:hypothetical protein [bacterium]